MIENNNPDPLGSDFKRRPVVLLLLDGWGISKTRDNNAIRLAKIPNFKSLVAHYPAAVISGSAKKDSVNYTIIGAGSEKPKKKINLSKIISQHNLKQLKLAETEKFALVSNFFNNSEQQLLGETYDLVPSPVKEAELDVAMATTEVVKHLAKALKSQAHDFILISLANIDSISHTGNFAATIKAIEFIDKALKRISALVLRQHGTLLITSSHGYAEEVFDLQTDIVNKENSDNPVPFIVVGEAYAGKTIGLAEAPANDLSLLEPIGSLVDIAPTILALMNLPQPPEMSGESLI